MTPTSPSRYADAGLRGWRTELSPARAQPELADVVKDTDPARRAAYWLAVVLGNCRLRALDLGTEDGTLLVPVALAAARRLALLLQRWSDEARHLEERLAEVDGEVEANDLCFDLLEARMEAWAAFVAIDEAYHAHLAAPPSAAEFTALVDQLLDRTEELDRHLQAQQDLLSLVAPYPLLDNWKRALGQPYSDALPWWLDGRLQEVAALLEKDSPTWLPRRRGHPTTAANGAGQAHRPAPRPASPPRLDAGQRLQHIVLSWRGDERGQGAEDLYRECRDAVGPGARDLLPTRLLFVQALDAGTLADAVRRLPSLGRPPQFRVRPAGRFDAALVPAGPVGQPADRWLLALDPALSPREQVGLFAHALAHFLFDREQVRLGFARHLDPRDGRTHCDVLAELRLGENTRQPLDRRVLDAFPLLADLLHPREEGHATQTTVTAALKQRLGSAGWRGAHVTGPYQFTNGRIYVGEDGPRHGRPGYGDALLRAQPSLPIALAQRVRPNQSPEEAQRALTATAKGRLLLPFAYLFPHDGSILESNGASAEAPPFHPIERMPEPGELLTRWLNALGLDDEQPREALTWPYGSPADRRPRYYQEAAINLTVAAVLQARRGLRQPRILINLATGTGKTKVAFEIVWKLKRARAIKNMLFLTDRDYLLSQAMDNDFGPFGEARARILGRKDTAHDILFATYHALADREDAPGLYREYPRNYFDLVLIDECHRGSAGDESRWRRILDYFDSAVQIGLTATPRKDDNVTTYNYFGDPIITYSLRQGINDGFLAPYNVRRVLMRESPARPGEDAAPPTLSKEDQSAAAQQVESDDTMRASTMAIAQHLARYLHDTDPLAKTIVFCVDQEHADAMRTAINQACQELGIGGDGYVERIVSEEGMEGRRALGRFSDPEERLPVVVTTSKLLSTGVDVPTCKNIALARRVGSVIEFKQIIGRGTRLLGPRKTWFTILDYSGATSHFYDPDFDGDPDSVAVEDLFPRPAAPAVEEQPELLDEPVPEAVPEAAPDQAGTAATPPVGGPAPPPAPVSPPPGPITEVPLGAPTPPPAAPGEEARPPEQPAAPPAPPPTARRRPRPRDGRQIAVVGELVYELGPDGVTLREVPYLEYAREAIGHLCPDVEQLRQRWLQPETRAEVEELLGNAGVDLAELGAALNVPDSDPLDVLVRALFRQPVPTRRDRADRLRREHAAWLDTFAAPAREVLEVILDKYAVGDADDVADTGLLRVPPLSERGTFMELARRFGGGAALRQALAELKRRLY